MSIRGVEREPKSSQMRQEGESIPEVTPSSASHGPDLPPLMGPMWARNMQRYTPCSLGTPRDSADVNVKRGAALSSDYETASLLDGNEFGGKENLNKQCNIGDKCKVCTRVQREIAMTTCLFGSTYHLAGPNES